MAPLTRHECSNGAFGAFGRRANGAFGAFGRRANGAFGAFGRRAKRPKRAHDLTARVEYPIRILARHPDDDRRSSDTSTYRAPPSRRPSDRTRSPPGRRESTPANFQGSRVRTSRVTSHGPRSGAAVPPTTSHFWTRSVTVVPDAGQPSGDSSLRVFPVTGPDSPLPILHERAVSRGLFALALPFSSGMDRSSGWNTGAGLPVVLPDG